MPELPEVEVTRLSFAERIARRARARRCGSASRCAGRWAARPSRWSAARVGEVSAARQVPVAAAAADRAAGGGLLMHLGMSGSLRVRDAAAGAPGPHDHFDLVTTRGTLRLTDPRRFGAVVWSPAIDADRRPTLLAGLGVEPFDPAFDARSLHAALRGAAWPIKPALLAATIVVGAGNIYACEALFAAGIDPRTRSDRLSRAALRAPAGRACATTLARALELGGSTLRDFRDAHGMAGEFQLEARVYGREGQPCLRCGAPVRRIVQAQRSTFFCPRCQTR